VKELRFYEYGGYVNRDGLESDLTVDCPLSDSELRYLKSLATELVPGKKVFEISDKHIRATSQVGVISFGAVQIEILPKLLRNNQSREKHSSSSILQNLMFMLSFTHNLDVEDTGVGELSRGLDSFIEIYIKIFASRLSKHLARYGVPKSYVEKSENLNAIRGKISFARHCTVNAFDQSRVYCDFSEFSQDNKLSGSLKYVANSLLNLTRNSNSVTSLSRCLGLLAGVNPIYVTADEIDRLVIGKRDPNFLALMNLTKMFLKKMRPEFSGQRQSHVFTLLFDMNELFEEFIFQVLKRNERPLEIEVTAQKRRRLVTAERDFLRSGVWEKRNLFDT